MCRSLMETKLKTGTTLTVDHYSYSGVAFSSAKGLGVECCKVKILFRLFINELLCILSCFEKKSFAGTRGLVAGSRSGIVP